MTHIRVSKLMANYSADCVQSPCGVLSARSPRAGQVTFLSPPPVRTKFGAPYPINYFKFRCFLLLRPLLTVCYDNTSSNVLYAESVLNIFNIPHINICNIVKIMNF
jgi:hypothetical protein